MPLPRACARWLNDTDVAVRTEAAPSGSVLESLMDSMDTALEYLRIK